MKKILPALILLLLLFCIIFSTTAQSKNNGNTLFNRLYTPSVNILNLPSNRAAFIFTNSKENSTYTNPAVAVLNSKSNNSITKESENKVTSVYESIKSEILQENVSMFSNLTEDELWIKLNEKIKTPDELNVEIYNENGERLYNSRFEKNIHKINLCNLIAGSFLVKMGDVVQKIIIE